MTKVSIIILNWNTKDLLKQCLDSVVRDLGGLGNVGVEIIIVDNGSTDDSVAIVKKFIREHSDTIRDYSGEVILIENKKNLGYAKGNNLGIKQAIGEYVMLLNTDIIIKHGAIKKLIAVLDKQPKEVAAVSPLILNSDGSIQKDPCFLKFPTPFLVLFYYNPILKKIALKYFPKTLFSITDFSKTETVDQLPGAAIMIRKKILDKIGLFDENYHIYFEDSDLCIRMKKAGYKFLIEPSVKIIHIGRQSIKPVIEKEGLERFYFLNFKSLFYFCRKHCSSINYSLIKMIILIQLLITGKYKLFKNLFTE